MQLFLRIYHLTIFRLALGFYVYTKTTGEGGAHSVRLGEILYLCLIILSRQESSMEQHKILKGDVAFVYGWITSTPINDGWGLISILTTSQNWWRPRLYYTGWNYWIFGIFRSLVIRVLLLTGWPENPFYTPSTCYTGVPGSRIFWTSSLILAFSISIVNTIVKQII